MRHLAVVLVALASAACDPSAKLPDGDLVDGIWVGREMDCATASDPGLCDALLTCAVRAEFGEADPRIAAWEWHAVPDRLRDGTLVTSGGLRTIVVFQLADGGRRAAYVTETDRCR